ncbi:MAG: hypothetical protein RIC24_15435 [Hyphomicrobiales bacterium]|jgi:hypothetical protein
MRVVDVVCLVAAIGGAAYVYNVKHGAEVAHGERRSLEREIGALSRDVGLLEADLAALEQPARLQAVVSDLPDVFDLEPITSAHYVRLSDIPFRSDLIVEDETLEGEDTLSADQEVPVAINAPGQIDLLLQVLNVGMAEPQAAPVAPSMPSDGIGALLENVTGQGAQ